MTNWEKEFKLRMWKKHQKESQVRHLLWSVKQWRNHDEIYNQEVRYDYSKPFVQS